LRGSGRFAVTTVSRLDDLVLFQSPSLRGSGRFIRPVGWRAILRESVSIPFIAGQWSLPDGIERRRFCARDLFQSPSLRGSGRFRFYKKLGDILLF